MIIKKYQSLIIKLLACLKIDNIKRPRLLIKLFKFFYYLILLPFEILGDFVFSYKRFSKNKIINPQTILIIKVDQLGDLLFSTMLLPLIKSKYPTAQIDYLINPKAEAILLKNPHVNKVYFWRNWLLANVPGRGKFSLVSWTDNFKVWLELKNKKYDVIINARAYMPSGNLPWRLLKPKKLIAFDIAGQSFLADAWANYDLYKEEWQNYLNLLKPLSINELVLEPRAEFYNLVPVNISANRLVVMAPVSFNPERAWSKEKWSQAVEFLQARGYQVVLSGLEAHRVYLEAVKGDSEALVFIDSMPKLAGLIKQSALFLGIDSFSAHLALALGRPLICLVDTKLYYVKNKSHQVLIDGRSMIPQFANVKIFDLDEAANTVLQSVYRP